jgi:hypothetical protein
VKGVHYGCGVQTNDQSEFSGKQGTSTARAITKIDRKFLPRNLRFGTSSNELLTQLANLKKNLRSKMTEFRRF